MTRVWYVSLYKVHNTSIRTYSIIDGSSLTPYDGVNKRKLSFSNNINQYYFKCYVWRIADYIGRSIFSFDDGAKTMTIDMRFRNGVIGTYNSKDICPSLIDDSVNKYSLLIPGEFCEVKFTAIFKDDLLLSPYREEVNKDTFLPEVIKFADKNEKFSKFTKYDETIVNRVEVSRILSNNEMPKSESFHNKGDGGREVNSVNGTEKDDTNSQGNILFEVENEVKDSFVADDSPAEELSFIAVVEGISFNNSNGNQDMEDEHLKSDHMNFTDENNLTNNKLKYLDSITYTVIILFSEKTASTSEVLEGENNDEFEQVIRMQVPAVSVSRLQIPLRKGSPQLELFPTLHNQQQNQTNGLNKKDYIIDERDDLCLEEKDLISSQESKLELQSQSQSALSIKKQNENSPIKNEPISNPTPYFQSSAENPTLLPSKLDEKKDHLTEDNNNNTAKQSSSFAFTSSFTPSNSEFLYKLKVAGFHQDKTDLLIPPSSKFETGFNSLSLPFNIPLSATDVPPSNTSLFDDHTAFVLTRRGSRGKAKASRRGLHLMKSFRMQKERECVEAATTNAGFSSATVDKEDEEIEKHDSFPEDNIGNSPGEVVNGSDATAREEMNGNEIEDEEDNIAPRRKSKAKAGRGKAKRKAKKKTMALIELTSSSSSCIAGEDEVTGNEKYGNGNNTYQKMKNKEINAGVNMDETENAQLELFNMESNKTVSGLNEILIPKSKRRGLISNQLHFIEDPDFENEKKKSNKKFDLLAEDEDNNEAESVNESENDEERRKFSKRKRSLIVEEEEEEDDDDEGEQNASADSMPTKMEDTLAIESNCISTQKHSNQREASFSSDQKQTSNFDWHFVRPLQFWSAGEIRNMHLSTQLCILTETEYFNLLPFLSGADEVLIKSSSSDTKSISIKNEPDNFNVNSNSTHTTRQFKEQNNNLSSTTTINDEITTRNDSKFIFSHSFLKRSLHFPLILRFPSGFSQALQSEILSPVAAGTTGLVTLIKQKLIDYEILGMSFIFNPELSFTHIEEKNRYDYRNRMKNKIVKVQSLPIINEELVVRLPPTYNGGKLLGRIPAGGCMKMELIASDGYSCPGLDIKTFGEAGDVSKQTVSDISATARVHALIDGSCALIDAAISASSISEGKSASIRKLICEINSKPETTCLKVSQVPISPLIANEENNESDVIETKFSKLHRIHLVADSQHGQFANNTASIGLSSCRVSQFAAPLGGDMRRLQCLDSPQVAQIAAAMFSLRQKALHEGYFPNEYISAYETLAGSANFFSGSGFRCAPTWLKTNIKDVSQHAANGIHLLATAACEVALAGPPVSSSLDANHNFHLNKRRRRPLDDDMDGPASNDHAQATPPCDVPSHTHLLLSRLLGQRRCAPSSVQAYQSSARNPSAFLSASTDRSDVAFLSRLARAVKPKRSKRGGATSNPTNIKGFRNTYDAVSILSSFDGDLARIAENLVIESSYRFNCEADAKAFSDAAKALASVPWSLLEKGLIPDFAECSRAVQDIDISFSDDEITLPSKKRKKTTDETAQYADESVVAEDENFSKNASDVDMGSRQHSFLGDETDSTINENIHTNTNVKSSLILSDSSSSSSEMENNPNPKKSFSKNLRSSFRKSSSTLFPPRISSKSSALSSELGSSNSISGPHPLVKTFNRLAQNARQESEQLHNNMTFNETKNSSTLTSNTQLQININNSEDANDDPTIQHDTSIKSIDPASLQNMLESTATACSANYEASTVLVWHMAENVMDPSSGLTRQVAHRMPSELFASCASLHATSGDIPSRSDYRPNNSQVSSFSSQQQQQVTQMRAIGRRTSRGSSRQHLLNAQSDGSEEESTHAYDSIPVMQQQHLFQREAENRFVASNWENNVSSSTSNANDDTVMHAVNFDAQSVKSFNNRRGYRRSTVLSSSHPQSLIHLDQNASLTDALDIPDGMESVSLHNIQPDSKGMLLAATSAAVSHRNINLRQKRMAAPPPGAAHSTIQQQLQQHHHYSQLIRSNSNYLAHQQQHQARLASCVHSSMNASNTSTQSPAAFAHLNQYNAIHQLQQQQQQMQQLDSQNLNSTTVNANQILTIRHKLLQQQHHTSMPPTNSGGIEVSAPNHNAATANNKNLQPSPMSSPIVEPSPIPTPGTVHFPPLISSFGAMPPIPGLPNPAEVPRASSGSAGADTASSKYALGLVSPKSQQLLYGSLPAGTTSTAPPVPSIATNPISTGASSTNSASGTSSRRNQFREVPPANTTRAQATAFNFLELHHSLEISQRIRRLSTFSGPIVIEPPFPILLLNFEISTMIMQFFNDGFEGLIHHILISQQLKLKQIVTEILMHLIPSFSTKLSEFENQIELMASIIAYLSATQDNGVKMLRAFETSPDVAILEPEWTVILKSIKNSNQTDAIAPSNESPQSINHQQNASNSKSPAPSENPSNVHLSTDERRRQAAQTAAKAISGEDCSPRALSLLDEVMGPGFKEALESLKMHVEGDMVQELLAEGDEAFLTALAKVLSIDPSTSEATPMHDPVISVCDSQSHATSTPQSNAVRNITSTLSLPKRCLLLPTAGGSTLVEWQAAFSILGTLADPDLLGLCQLAGVNSVAAFRQLGASFLDELDRTNIFSNQRLTEIEIELCVNKIQQFVSMTLYEALARSTNPVNRQEVGVRTSAPVNPSSSILLGALHHFKAMGELQRRLPFKAAPMHMLHQMDTTSMALRVLLLQTDLSTLQALMSILRVQQDIYTLVIPIVLYLLIYGSPQQQQGARTFCTTNPHMALQNHHFYLVQPLLTSTNGNPTLTSNQSTVTNPSNTNANASNSNTGRPLQPSPSIPHTHVNSITATISPFTSIPPPLQQQPQSGYIQTSIDVANSTIPTTQMISAPFSNSNHQFSSKFSQKALPGIYSHNMSNFHQPHQQPQNGFQSLTRMPRLLQQQQTQQPPVTPYPSFQQQSINSLSSIKLNVNLVKDNSNNKHIETSADANSLPSNIKLTSSPLLPSTAIAKDSSSLEYKSSSQLASNLNLLTIPLNTALPPPLPPSTTSTTSNSPSNNINVMLGLSSSASSPSNGNAGEAAMKLRMKLQARAHAIAGQKLSTAGNGILQGGSSNSGSSEFRKE